jgi:hypothetical protein
MAVAAGSGWAAAAAGDEPCGSQGEWHVVSSPSPGETSNALRDIAALNAEFMWAVGRSHTWGTPAIPIALRWDGSAWASVPAPDTSLLGTSPELDAVAIAPNGDVWAVGNVNPPGPLNNKPLVMRWPAGGDVWDEVASVELLPQIVYPYAPRSGVPYCALALADDDVWVMGTAAGWGDASAVSIALALHWDGSEWTEIPPPIVSNRTHILQGVARVGDEIWAVGYRRDVAGPYLGVIYRWSAGDGTRNGPREGPRGGPRGGAWEVVPNPADDIIQSFLMDIVATGPNEVWVVGEQPGGALFMHYNGSSWTVVESPVDATTRIASVAAIAADGIWAVSAFTPNFYHYDGNQWSFIGNPPVDGATSVNRAGGLVAVGSCNVWSAGSWSDGTSSYTLLERLEPGAVPGNPADLNGDGVVDVLDLLILLDNWGTCQECGDCPADLNNDCAVDVLDLLLLLDAWR